MTVPASVGGAMFEGFPPEAHGFLARLGVHNTKVWFAAHRGEYERFLLEPMRELVRDLSEPMLIIDPDVIVEPAVGKAISRMHRDTRFSKDKSPYRNAMWLVFKRPSEQWQDWPAFFFEIGAEGYRYGMGFYGAAPRTMAAFRALVEARPEAFRKAIGFYPRQRALKLRGETYKRPLAHGLPAELDAWYQRRNLYLIASKKPGRSLRSGALVHELARAFAALSPLYHFLLRARGGEDPAPHPPPAILRRGARA